MVLQSTIGDDGFSIQFHRQIEIAQSYQENHALLPHAMGAYICQNRDLNSSKWGPKLVKMIGEMTFVWTGKGRKASESLYQPKNTELF